MRAAPVTPAEPTLADVMRELAAIRALLEAGRRPAPLTRDDRDLLARLLPPIVAAWGSEPFASRDLVDDPEKDWDLEAQADVMTVKDKGKRLATPIDRIGVWDKWGAPAPVGRRPTGPYGTEPIYSKNNTSDGSVKCESWPRWSRGFSNAT